LRAESEVEIEFYRLVAEKAIEEQEKLYKKLAIEIIFQLGKALGVKQKNPS